MSAWLVSKEHIDVLVTAGITTGLIKPAEAVATGDMLWRANAANIRYLYEERADECEPVEAEGYTEYRPLGVEDPAWAFKQIVCFDYQSCDQSGWGDSSARHFVTGLLDRLTALVGVKDYEEVRKLPGYHNACWGVQVRDDGSLIVTNEDFSAWCAEWHAKQRGAA